MDLIAGLLLPGAANDVKPALWISEHKNTLSLTENTDTSSSNLSSGGAKRSTRTGSTKACDRCYSRKVRCLGSGSEDAPAPCKSCLSAGVTCTYGQPEYRTRRKKASPESDKNAAAKKETAAVEKTNNNADAVNEPDLASQLLQLLRDQLANGGTAAELKASLRLDPMFASNGTTYPIAMPGYAAVQNLPITNDGLSIDPLPNIAPAPQFGELLKADSLMDPLISFALGQQPFDFSGLDTSFASLFGANLPQIPSVQQLPTPLFQSPTPVVEPPHYLLSRRQRDELVDAYFNFINPYAPFLHPGHFWNEYRAGRIPEFLLDAVFAVSVRYMNPRVNALDSFGMSLYALSQRDVYRGASEPSGSASPPSTSGSSSRGGSSATPMESERSWNDVEYEEYVLLGKLLHERALEWVPKLKERQASISLVHTLIILVLMELSRARHYADLGNLKETAVRLATFLSLNVDLPGKLFEKNIRRRTWWCLLIMEVHMSYGSGTCTSLPASYAPSFPEVDPHDGSATGPWSPEATRAFVASADISRIMVDQLRAVDSSTDHSANMTDEYLDLLREWEARHAQALLPPRRSNSTILNEHDIYPWVLSASANISKYGAILVCLRPAALAFQLGADEDQDWSPHIRHNLARKFRPSYSAWIATQNAAHAITEIMDKTPHQVLTRIPLLNLFAFPAVALSFQTLLHTRDANISGEAAKMLSRLCGGMSTANPWGKGLMYDRVTEFCLRFARLYLEHNHESLYTSMIEQSKGLSAIKETAHTETPCKLTTEQAQEMIVTEGGLRDASEPEVTNLSHSYQCEGLFMEPSAKVEPKPKKKDWSKPWRADEITLWDFKEVELSLMGPLPEIKVFIFKHLDFPQEVFDS
ncbi:hypothetical protein BJ742DRAFT_510850 [Cladochytrium replicatum]|nr:hypothetical protein BJ742DRAFT_510850 [Cladochytrium replicatum]